MRGLCIYLTYIIKKLVASNLVQFSKCVNTVRGHHVTYVKPKVCNQYKEPKVPDYVDGKT